MKKGFTLIELLAVIVILAILALIVSPIISGVIADAKEAAAARSTEGYVKAVEYAVVKNQYKNNGAIETNVDNLSVEFSGHFTSATAEINPTTGLVDTATVSDGTFTCTYTKANATPTSCTATED